MAYEHKSAWIDLVVALAGYGVYLAVVLSRAGGAPLAEVAYTGPLLVSIGAAIAAGIVLRIAVGVIKRDTATDERDREIGRFGDHIGQSFVIVGAVAAMALALLEAGHFWIANAVYLCFVLSASLAAAARIAAYQRGLHAW
ncbi:hypothetical protein ACFPM7_25580 [Actinokineospora guangxiensis]|uniref:Integral membrane protein n=1 Tax=Actinokineospora guangxiensis TaxID=1490288 RepID=A0ABW0EU48_9PSEU